MNVYLLNIGELMSAGADVRMVSMLHRLDEDRRKKVTSAGTLRGRAAAFGAGLLLQKAAGDWQADGFEGCPEESGETEQEVGFPEQPPRFRHCTLSGLLSEQTEAFSLTYRYGEKGKPYFREIPLCFSLSHSGDYVLCAVSRQEVGADLQKIQPVDVWKLAKRFFSESECRTLERCESEGERQRLFFGFWSRKEAFGKLTGEGVAAVLREDLQDGDGQGTAELPEAVERCGDVQHGGGKCTVEQAETVPYREEDGQDGSRKRAAELPEAAPFHGEGVRSVDAERNVEWMDFTPPEGYSVAVCRFRGKELGGERAALEPGSET